MEAPATRPGDRGMNVSSEKSISLWMGTKVVDDAPALNRNEKADVVVVGSGIAGMSVAYELAKAGKDVVIIDRGPIGKGMTSRTTAHLTAQCDDGFDQLISRRGEETAKLWYQSQAACIDRIEANVKELGIDCDFRRLDGHLFHAPGTDPGIIDQEFEATKKVGMPIAREKGVPFRTHEETPSLRYPNQATFHPLKYLAGLAAAIRKAGGRFYAETTVEHVEEDENGVEVTGRQAQGEGTPCRGRHQCADQRQIRHPYQAGALSHLCDGVCAPQRRAARRALLGYARGLPLRAAAARAGRKNDILIVGGADHKSGEADDADARFLALEAWMRNLLPDLGKELHRWSGQIQDTIDYCAFIGRNPGEKRTFIVTGDSGQGITHGAVAGMLISDLILKGESPWEEVYDPSRKPVKAAGTFLSENLTTAKNFAEYVAPGEISSYDELKPGQGAIVRKGLSKVAAYRDEKGKLFLRSAACSHLGAICTGTVSSAAGTAPATARSSRPTARR